MTLAIQNAQNADNDEHFNMLLYGPPGAGKTYLARTASAAGFKVLFLDAETGRRTLKGADVDVAPINDPSAMNDVFGLLSGDHDYDVVFLDTLSELQKKYVDKIKGRGQMQLQQWGDVVDWTKRLVRKLRDTPINVVVSCHSKEIQDDEGLRIRPDLHGKSLPHEIGAHFDVVGYPHGVPVDGGVEFKIGFQGGGERHITKDRSQALDPVENADYGTIAAKVLGPGTKLKSGRVLDAIDRMEYPDNETQDPADQAQQHLDNHGAG